MQSAATEVKTYLSSVFEKVEAGIMLSDLKGNVLDANPFFLNMLGLSREEFIGRKPDRVLPSPGTYSLKSGQVLQLGDEFLTERDRRLADLAQAGEVKNWETYYLCKSGKLVPVKQTLCLLKDAEGRNLASLCLVQDAADKQNLEAELAKAKKLAASARELKDFFLSKISQDIRVPMNGIFGFAELLIENADITDEYKEQLQDIKRSSEDLLSMINNVIDYSKLESGKAEIAEIAFDIELLFYSIIHEARSRLAGSAVELQHEITNQVPFLLKGDPSRIRQIMSKLLENAMRYTALGTIRVKLDIDAERESDVRVSFQVRDTGIGIPPENLESIFEVAEPGGGLFPRQGKGHGLGLHLCRRIACLMGGDLFAESEPGQGSCFHFTIALARVEKPQAFRPSSVALAGKTVFILDFEKIHRNILSKLCRQAGMEVITCGSTITIPGQLEDLIIEKTRIDLFIIDVSTQDDAIRPIIELIRENFGMHVPLLAFVSPNRGAAKACQSMGFNGCLSKPCSKLPLYEIMKHLLAEDFDMPGRREILTRYSLSEEIKHNLNILVVDDNHVNQMVAMKILARSGYAVDSAANGLEAVNKVLADPHKYDVILMDINMPIMNGIDAALLLRQNHIEVPIIAYTANARQEDIEKILQAGMNDCIPKPINREIVLEKLYHLCFRPESRALLEHEPGHC